MARFLMIFVELMQLVTLGNGFGGGRGSSGSRCPSSLSFSNNWPIGMWSSLNFLWGLELTIDDLTALLLMWQGTTSLGIESIDMFLLIGEDSWKGNSWKSLALFFRNWKCGISSGSIELSLHKVDSIAWLAKLTCNEELAIQEIWASSSFVFSWSSRMELRPSSILF